MSKNSNPVFVTNEISTSTQTFDSYLANFRKQNQAKQASAKPVVKVASTQAPVAKTETPVVKTVVATVVTKAPVKKAEMEKEKDLSKAQEKLPEALKKAIEKKEDKKSDDKPKDEKKEDKKDDKAEDKKSEDKKDEKKDEKDCMASTKTFVRVAKLNGKTRNFLKEYFLTLYPADYVNAMLMEN